MHQVQYVDVGINSSDGSTQCQSIVPTRIFDSPNQKFPLDATTSPNFGDQEGPSPNNTSQDVIEESSIECESFYPGALCVVSKGSFPVTFLVEKDYFPIKIPKIVGIIKLIQFFFACTSNPHT